MTVDPFSLDSGFPTDYSATVVDAWFGVPEDTRRGTNMMMVWKMQLDDPANFPQADGGIWEESFGCGDGWETPDGGETVVSPGVEDKRFRANSGYGIVCAKCLEFGMGELLRSRGGSFREAKIWKGLRFHIDAVPYEFTNRETKEKVKGSKNYPMEFLGEADGVSLAAGSGYAPSDLGATEEQFAQLQTLAKTASSYGKFMDESLGVDGVQDNDKLVMAIAEEGFYNYLRDAETF